jgi:HEPN domain-containing protein
MNNDNDFRDWLTKAQDHLRRAESNLGSNERAIVVHYAQLAIELSAKTIISYFYEPAWSHEPSDELHNVIRTYGKKLEKRLGKTTMRAIHDLAIDAKTYAPWHVWSTYGKRELGQKPLSPDEVCTPAVVADLMPRARQAVALAKRFAELFH